MLFLLQLFAVICTCKITLFTPDGHSPSEYKHLTTRIESFLSSTPSSQELCIGHSTRSVNDIIAATSSNSRCGKGVVLTAAVPEIDQIKLLDRPVLMVFGTHDGVNGFTRFAVLRHLVSLDSELRNRVRFAVIDGMGHIVGDGANRESRFGLRAPLSSLDIQQRISQIVSEWIASGGLALSKAEYLASKMSQPLIDALKMEGSDKLGSPWCNSDFPTNPSCNYPKYPDFSLPFGPAPAPNPPLPSDCVCGSQWVETVGNSIVSGELLQPFSVFARDAFHDVSDEHPFHLPHIWNDCSEPISCTLNLTTLTMPVFKDGALFPNNSTVSAFEMRAKIKSRQTIWEAAGINAPNVDKNMTMCRDINTRAYEWALGKADSSVRERFLKDGEPMVMVDDKEAPIGITGPQWIKDELVYKRVTDPSTNKSRIEIQSWTFIVGESPIKSKIIPSGMHYCKLLSPARAMEWIYTDGLRHKLSY